MKTTTCLLATLFLLALQSFGQGKKDPEWSEAVTNTDNLVANGDFEDTDMKHLKNYGQLNELNPDWFGATQAQPDIYAEGVKSEKVSIPNNLYGVQEAYSGSSYAGFRAYTKDLKLTRTYLEAKLNSKLIKDRLYCITMQISLADLSKNAVNNIGIFFSDRKVAQPNTGVMSLVPQVTLKNNAVASTMNGWETVCATYSATGLEEYIIIGCFGTDDKIQIEKVKKPANIPGIQVNHAYYYLDAIEILEVEAQSQCFCGTAAEKEPDVIYSRATGITDEMKPADIVPRTAAYFAFLSDEVNSLFEEDLSRLAAIMKSDPTLRLEIIGHSDTDEMNEAKINYRYAGMAQSRADAVKKWLVDQGIAENRLTTVSRDNTELVSTTPTPMSKAQNRRVVFILK